MTVDWHNMWSVDRCSQPCLEFLERRPMLRNHVLPGGSRIELIYRPRGPDPRKLNDEGLNHLSLGLKTSKHTYERLVKEGVNFFLQAIKIPDETHPLFGWYVTYLRDPRGTVLELLGPDPTSNDDTGERRSLVRGATQ